MKGFIQKIYIVLTKSKVNFPCLSLEQGFVMKCKKQPVVTLRGEVAIMQAVATKQITGNLAEIKS